MNYIQYSMKSAQTLILAAYSKAVSKGELPEVQLALPTVEVPKDIKNGDYACSFAMQNAKKIGKPPRGIAEALVRNMAFEGSCFVDAKVAGPGFINLFLDAKWFCEVIYNILAEGKDYGKSKAEKPEKIMVEFVSANPTGPMHMGNARGGVLGDCLAEVLTRAGHQVEREFYVNDAGNQIDKFAISLEARYKQIILGDDAVEFPADCYQGADIRALAQKYFDANGDSLMGEAEEHRRAVLAEFGLANNIPKMKSDLERYKIVYDNWFMESILHESGLVKKTVDLFTKAGKTYEKDDALWLKTSDLLREKYTAEGKAPEEIEKLELKDDVLLRGNGNYTYFAADIAYHYNKFVERSFDRVINVWGADHHGHVARLQCALDALGLDGSHRLEIVLMQLVELKRDGQVVRMSKRTGNAIALADLLDEISVDAARYFFNSRASDTHLEFDLGLAVRQDSENPVYYVQYAHARIKSILKALVQDGIALPKAACGLELLREPSELDLIRQLSKLPEEISLAAQSREPSRLNRYAVQLATAFHRFYTECRIKDSEPALRDARICLINAVATTIENTLSTFGVTAPESM